MRGLFYHIYDAFDYLASGIAARYYVVRAGSAYQQKLGQKDCQDVLQKYIQNLESLGLEPPNIIKEMWQLMPGE